MAVDLPGHGGSSDIHANLEETALLIGNITAGEPFAVMGYSLGARVALTASLLPLPGLTQSILISGTAGIADDEERAARRVRDFDLADEIEREHDLPAFLDRWLSQAMFANLSAQQAGASDRLDNSVAGLASSLRLCGQGSQTPSWQRLANIAIPVDLIVGSQDRKYRELNESMVASLPNGRLHVIEDAGHAVHLERAHDVAAVVADCLAT